MGLVTRDPKSTMVDESMVAMEVDPSVGNVDIRSGSTPVNTGVSGMGTPTSDIEMHVAGIDVLADLSVARGDRDGEVEIPSEVRSAILETPLSGE